MSPDLTRSLHDAVDTGPDDSPFDVTSLTGRIRRRRTVRAGVRGGVAVGAAGAVALGAVYAGGRQPYSALPAARADAGPGTCGSDIGLLPLGDTAAARLVPFASEGSWNSYSPDVVDPGTELARLGGRTLSTVLVRRLSAEARDAAIAARVDDATEKLADAEARRESERNQPAGSVPAADGRVQSLDLAVDFARRQLEDATDPTTLSGVGDELHSQILVTHGTTVVATDTDPGATVHDLWNATGGGAQAVTVLNTDLSTCTSPGEPGGIPLPAGEYAVYVSYDAADGKRAATGPWPVTLLTPLPAPTALPEGFPVDDVPLVGGRLLSANPLSLSSGDGWGLEIAVEGDDAVTEAIRALGEDEPLAPTGTFTPDGYYQVGDWEVRVAAAVSASGEPSVIYTVRPR